ncbi:MAG: tetratricopeptide repeat protein [Pirellulaceae bacterium]|jgi:tetratricopeptide (TPR) repeat protein|nr:tetratricopeptide repeat protein [Pirellulaceae bacterium]
MSLLSQITGLFSRSGRDEQQLARALELAKAKQPEQALEIYDKLLASSGTNDTTRARALFNRALAHSSLNNDEQAIIDLNAVLELPNLPENVQSAARTQIARVRRRNT